MPIQPKTSEILPKFCQKLATTLRVHYPTGPAPDVLGILRADAALKNYGRCVQGERGGGGEEDLTKTANVLMH